MWRWSRVIEYQKSSNLGYYDPNYDPLLVPEKELIQDWIGFLGMRERQNNQEQYRIEFFSTSLFLHFFADSIVQKRIRREERHFYPFVIC